MSSWGTLAVYRMRKVYTLLLSALLLWAWALPDFGRWYPYPEALALAQAHAGTTAGQPAIPANRAKRVTPIIGENSTSRSGSASAGSASDSSAYLVTSAPPLE